MFRVIRLSTAIFALLLSAPAQAQQDEGELPPVFSSDRPGFANTTAVAARGHLTTEFGANVQLGDPTTTVDLPNLWFRTGILDWLEARVRAPDAYGVFQQGATPSYGLDDPAVGFKVGGSVADGVAISSDWEVSLPLGTDGFGANEPELRADAQMDWNFWGPLSLTPNVVASVRVAQDPMTGRSVRYFQGGGSLKLTYQILDVLAVFVQGYSIASDQKPLSVVVGGGIYGMVMRNWQLDASFNAGLMSQDMPPTVSAGTTVLW